MEPDPLVDKIWIPSKIRPEEYGRFVSYSSVMNSNVALNTSKSTVSTRPQDHGYKIKDPGSNQEDQKSQDQGAWDPRMGK